MVPDEINLLHLSDLHFNLKEDPKKNPELVAEREIALKELITCLKKLKENWRPDIIVISNDIGYFGKKGDYVDAKKWILKILKIWKLPLERIVICAGNHDLIRDMNTKVKKRPSSAEEADEWLILDNIYPFIWHFREFISFLRDNLKIRPFKLGVSKKYLMGHRNILGISFIVLNSAWFHYDDDAQGKLWLGKPHLQILEVHGHLADWRNYNEGNLVVAVFHHPQKYLDDYERGTYNRREGALDYLAVRSHLILCGHLHTEKIAAPDTLVQRATIFQVGATYGGTAYRNTFELLKINKIERYVTQRKFEWDNREWKEIDGLAHYNLKREDYNPQLIEELELAPTYTEISVQNLTISEIQKLKSFLDEINNLIEDKFPIIKENYFEGGYKVGILIYVPDNTWLWYSIFPFPKEIPSIFEIQNRFIETKGEKYPLLHEGVMRKYFFKEPKKEARKKIAEYLTTLFETKALNHQRSKFLAEEYIIATIDKFSDQLGLKIKEEYELGEIEDGINEYLPIWIEEALKFITGNLRDRLSSRNYYDPETVSFSLGAFQLDRVEENVKRRLKESPLQIPKFAIENHKLPFHTLKKFIENLKELNVKKVRRIYQSLEEEEDILYNLKILAQNFVEVLNQILGNNFLNVKDELIFLEGATKILIFIGTNTISNERDFYEYNYHITYYLKNPTESDITLDVHSINEAKYKEFRDITRAGREIEYDDKKYKLISIATGELSFIYEDTPMLNMVYKEILLAIKKNSSLPIDALDIHRF